MMRRMNIARRIKKNRIKRKQRRGKPGGNRIPRHVFNRHEPWGLPKWNKRRRKERNVGRRRSAPKSKEALRKVATMPSNEMRDIDVVLRGTTYIASSLVVGMVYLLAVIGLTFCMPPAIFVVVYYIFVSGCPRWILYELCKILYISSAIYLTVSLVLAKGAIMASFWSVATAWNLIDSTTNQLTHSFAQKYIAFRYSDKFVRDYLVHPFVEGMFDLLKHFAKATINYIGRQYIEFIHGDNKPHYPLGMNSLLNLFRLGLRQSSPLSSVLASESSVCYLWQYQRQKGQSFV